MEMGGGKYPFDKAKGKPQKAFVEFLCDPDRTGLEGEEFENEKSEGGRQARKGLVSERRGAGDTDQDEKKDDDDEEKDDDDEGDDDGDGNDDDDDDDDERPDDGKSLRFISYKDEGDDDVGVLRLEWRTKYACEGEEAHQPEGDKKKKASWGFFTWFIIM